MGSAEAPQVAVIIPTYNRRAPLLRCLGHVQALQGVSHRAIVVCDGSTDGTQAAVREQYPDTLVVEGDGNLWWSGAINAGITAAQGIGARYFCLLNDDVQPDPQMLAALVRAAEANPGALVGSKVYFLRQPERVWSAGGKTDWLRNGAYQRGNDRVDGPEWSAPAEVEWLPGMGTLIPAEVVERVGMMDARHFPQYFGDVDFCLRARRAGVKVLLCPEAKLYNDVELTGALLPKGAINWKIAATVLGSQRSHSNWRTRLRFWARHCPAPLIPWQIVRFYGPLLAAIVKKLTWDRARA